MKIRQFIHELAFGLLLRLCEKTEQATGAAEGTGEVTYITWQTSRVSSVSGRSVYPFLVLTVRTPRGKLSTTISLVQAMLICAGGEQVIKDQMKAFGHTTPME